MSDRTDDNNWQTLVSSRFLHLKWQFEGCTAYFMKHKILSIAIAQPLILVLCAIAQSDRAFAQEVCVRNPPGNIVCGELVPDDFLQPQSGESPSESTERTIKTESGLFFTLDGCSRSNAGLTCGISVYNSTDFDKTLSYQNFVIYRAIDDRGNTYKATRDTSIANGNFTASLIPPKATVKSQLVFKPDGDLSNFIRILSLSPTIDNRSYEVTFRDFPID